MTDRTSLAEPSPAGRSRLNVVLFPPPLRAPSNAKSGQQDPASFVEKIVGHLAGQPGIDLMLMRALDQLAADSTEALALQSVQGAMVLLTWEPAESLLQTLKTMGVEGQCVPHRGHLPSHEPGHVDGVGMSARPFYYVDLSPYESIDPLLPMLQYLRATNSVQVVGLSVMPQKKTDHSRPPSSGSQHRVASPFIENTAAIEDALAPQDDGPTSPPGDSLHQLDRWINELDEFDV